MQNERAEENSAMDLSWSWLKKGFEKQIGPLHSNKKSIHDKVWHLYETCGKVCSRKVKVNRQNYPDWFE